MFATAVAHHIFAWESGGVDASGRILPVDQWRNIFHKSSGESWVTGYGINAAAHPSLASRLNIGYESRGRDPRSLSYKEAYEYWYENFYTKIPGVDLLPFRWQLLLCDAQFMGAGHYRDTVYWLTSRLEALSAGRIQAGPRWSHDHAQAMIYLTSANRRQMEIDLLKQYPKAINDQVAAMRNGVTGHVNRLKWRYQQMAHDAGIA